MLIIRVDEDIVNEHDDEVVKIRMVDFFQRHKYY